MSFLHSNAPRKLHRLNQKVLCLFLLGLSSTVSPIHPVFAQSTTQTDARIAASFELPIAEASRRFGLRTDLILAVIRVESAGEVHAVSDAGAMGLMQIMPATWADLRRRYRLGSDPFDPRDNIIAGTAYLREMYDQFGSPGFLAAYNAGPGRYANHVATGRALPRETRAYVATLVAMLRAEVLPAAETPGRDPNNWRNSALFLAQSADNPDATEPVGQTRLGAIDPTDPVPPSAGLTARSDGLFAEPTAEGAVP
jgi:hypothetical protein